MGDEADAGEGGEDGFGLGFDAGALGEAAGGDAGFEAGGGGFGDGAALEGEFLELRSCYAKRFLLT
jgi:hypothetical protein